jgi:SAM-dependent methyltransferase
VDLDGFRALHGEAGQTALAEVAALPAAGLDDTALLATATRLRRHHTPELVAAALTQARLRRRAVAKFGDDAARMYFTPAGLEQATRTPVAEARARRYAAAGTRRVADLCCGVGGDTVALARAGMEVLALDSDPLTCAVASANVAALGLAGRVEVRCADVTTALATGELDSCDAAFLDPARRTAARRVFSPDAYTPPWRFVPVLAARVPRTGVKVAPGIPHDLVPAGVEAEWVSDHGEVKEAALWFGDLASTARRATVLPSGASLTASEADRDTGTGRAAVAAPGRYLYEPDGAVIRAHLVAQLARLIDGALLDESIAYLTTDRLVPEVLAAGLATAYEITDVVPFHLKRLRRLLADRRVGTITVKKRGSAVEPEQLRRQLRPAGPHAAVVVLTRMAGAPTVLLCQPVRRSGGRPDPEDALA